MKKFRSSCFILLITGLFSSQLYANPIAIDYIIINELAYDSTGWRIEFLCDVLDDSLSLKGWYIVSGEDTAYFQDWMYAKEGYLVIALDSLKGKINIDPSGGGFSLFSNTNFFEGYIYFGANSDLECPPLKFNQSLCNYDLNFKYYIDYSPTIGTQNDTIDAIGSIHGYLYYTENKPANNIKLELVLLKPHTFSLFSKEVNRIICVTDSLGYFEFPYVYATNNTIYVRMKYSPIDSREFSVLVLPGENKFVELNLNWLTGIEDEAGLPINYSLEQNYPNPFNPSTVIGYTIGTSQLSVIGFVTLKIYDVLGREVTTLVYEQQSPGNYKVEFDARGLTSGIYFYKLQVSNSAGIEGFSDVKKLMVLK